jgi:hypothetical protein
VDALAFGGGEPWDHLPGVGDMIELVHFLHRFARHVREEAVAFTRPTIFRAPATWS